MGMTCFSSKWILSHSTWYKFRRSGQKFAEAVEGFLTWEQIREYLHQGPIQREPSRRTTLESITRSVRIVGGILQSLGKETKGVGGILVRAGGALWWLVQAAIPEGLTGHFAGKIFASFFWFAIVMIIGGTFFNQAVQSVGLKLLFFTTLLWLVKDAFQRYIQGGRRALRITAVWAVLALLIGVGAWASLQKLQRSEPPKKPTNTYTICGVGARRRTQNRDLVDPQLTRRTLCRLPSRAPETVPATDVRWEV
jgi:hypothetical protein